MWNSILTIRDEMFAARTREIEQRYASRRWFWREEDTFVADRTGKSRLAAASGNSEAIEGFCRPSTAGGFSRSSTTRRIRWTHTMLGASRRLTGHRVAKRHRRRTWRICAVR